LLGINEQLDKFKVGTHCGKQPCCSKGSEGAEIHQSILNKIKDNDIVITKKWFSAFRETNLKEVLDSLQIKKIYFAGVKTNVCVKTTMIDAINNGYDVTIIDDCTAATNSNKHILALTSIKELGGTIIKNINSLY